MFLSKSIKSHNGFYTVEAALCLPIILVVMIAMAFVIQVYEVEGNIVHVMCDEARLCMIKKNLISVDPTLNKRIKSRILKENHKATSCSTNSFQYGGRDFSEIFIRTDTYISKKIPFGIKDDWTIKARIKFRGFVGDKEKKKPFTFKRMEESEESTQVYIFPLCGERYHRVSCRYLNPEIAFSKGNLLLKEKYFPCDLCKPSLNESVCSFPKYGGAFHKKICKVVIKNYIVLNKKTAQGKGYLPCKICNP